MEIEIEIKITYFSLSLFRFLVLSPRRDTDGTLNTRHPPGLTKTIPSFLSLSTYFF